MQNAACMSWRGFLFCCLPLSICDDRLVPKLKIKIQDPQDPTLSQNFRIQDPLDPMQHWNFRIQDPLDPTQKNEFQDPRSLWIPRKIKIEGSKIPCIPCKM